jgi:hypothetical protein
VADRVKIADDGWEVLPRIAVALACRMVARGMPLFKPVEWRQQARHILEHGRRFSLGVQTNPFITEQDVRDALRQLGSVSVSDGGEAARGVFHATMTLGESIKLVSEALVRAEGQISVSEISDRMVAAGEKAAAARSIAGKAVFVAAKQDDGQKIERALQAERDALGAYRTLEIARLAADDEYDYVRIGPPFDPGSRGPLGPLWPAGAPSWYAGVGMADTAVKTADRFFSEGPGNADVVTYYLPERDVHAFLGSVLKFSAQVLKSSLGQKIPPTPCVYVPNWFKERDRSLVVGQLAAAGAVGLDDQDLNLRQPPASSEAFAEAVAKTMQRDGMDRPYDDRMAGFMPGNALRLPPLADSGWTEVPGASASYESFVKRSAEVTTDGWPSAE